MLRFAFKRAIPCFGCRPVQALATRQRYIGVRILSNTAKANHSSSEIGRQAEGSGEGLASSTQSARSVIDQPKECDFVGELLKINKEMRNRYMPVGEEVMNTFTVPEEGLSPDTVHDKVLAYIDSGELETASHYLNFYYECNSTDPQPLRLETFHVLLKDTLEAIGRGDVLINILKTMGERQISPDIETYNLILQFHGQEGNIDKLLIVFQEISQSEAQPNRETYNILLRYLSTLSNLDAAHSIMENMLSEGLELDASTFVTLMDSLVKQGRLQEAENEFQASVRAELATEPTVLGQALIVFARMHRFDRTDTIFDALVRSKGLPKAGQHVIDTYIYALIQGDRRAVILNALEKCVEVDCFPTYPCIQCIGSLFLTKQDSISFRHLLLLLNRIGIKPGMALLNQAMITFYNADSKQNDTHYNWNIQCFNELQKRNLWVDSRNIKCLLKAMNDNRERTLMVWKITEGITKLGVPMTTQMFTWVIAAIYTLSDYIQHVSSTYRHSSTKAHSQPKALIPNFSGMQKNMNKHAQDVQEAEKLGHKALPRFINYAQSRYPQVIQRLSPEVALQTCIVLWRWRQISFLEEFLGHHGDFKQDTVGNLALEMARSKDFIADDWNRVISQFIKRPGLTMGPIPFMSLLSALSGFPKAHNKATTKLLLQLTQTLMDRSPNNGRQYLKYSLEYPNLRKLILGPHEHNGKIRMALRMEAEDYEYIILQWVRDGNVSQIVSLMLSKTGENLSPKDFDHLIEAMIKATKHSPVPQMKLERFLEIIKIGLKTGIVEVEALSDILALSARILVHGISTHDPETIKEYIDFVHVNAPDPKLFSLPFSPPTTLSDIQKSEKEGKSSTAFNFFLNSGALDKLLNEGEAKAKAESGLDSSDEKRDARTREHPLGFYVELHRKLVDEDKEMALRLACALVDRAWIQLSDLYHALSAPLHFDDEFNYHIVLTKLFLKVKKNQEDIALSVFIMFLRRAISANHVHALRYSVEVANGFEQSTLHMLVSYLERPMQVRKPGKVVEPSDSQNVFTVFIKKACTLQQFDVAVWWMKLYEASSKKSEPISMDLYRFLYQRYSWAAIEKGSGNADFDVLGELEDLGVDISILEKEERERSTSAKAG
ncbi:hypothetical protein AAMO2058_001597900 [Amorphochlora amoebiformis]|uniref:Pentacotripeptide-repeat region of PRORP domain-containing protein n=1 Tax=Amorphochlora amoebiformis TaxID=1561963 RepID=A0A7S0CW97_9EUKA|mmetsp:Transcript_14915/g.23604  ORF Transcript_14915/g.23604 Transcript_14915/m.23604 type:complete len:1117 (+) Transcript_14915:136-3486(+)